VLQGADGVASFITFNILLINSINEIKTAVALYLSEVYLINNESGLKTFFKLK